MQGKKMMAFVLGAIAKEVFLAVVLFFGSIFFVQELLMDVAFVAKLIVVAKIIEAILQPIIGEILDRIQRSKRLTLAWLFFVTIIMSCVIGILLFVNIGLSDGIKSIYYLVMYVVFLVFYSIADISYLLFVTGYAINDVEKKTMIGISQIVGAFVYASVIVYGISIMPSLMSGTVLFVEIREVLWILSIVVIVAGVVMVKQIVRSENSSITIDEEIVPIATKKILKNHYFILIIGISLMIQLAITTVEGYLGIYFTELINNGTLYYEYIGITQWSMLIGGVIYCFCVKKLEGYTIFKIAVIVSVLGLVMQFCIGQWFSNITVLIFGAGCIYKIGVGILNCSILNLILDAVSVRTGFGVGVQRFIVKILVVPFSHGIVFLTDQIRYSGNVERIISTTLGINMMMNLGPAVMLLIVMSMLQILDNLKQDNN